MKKNVNVIYLFITSTCNAKCHFCFYGGELNKKEDLTVDEIKKISQSIGKVNSLMISGGEPFARQEIAEIINFFYINNHIRYVSIPINGSLVSRSVTAINKICKENPKLYLRIQVSLDSFSKCHDEIRKIPKGFDKAINLITKVKNLKKTHNNLSIGVNTVLSNFNEKHIESFTDYIAELDLDDHNVEIERPSLGTLSGNDILINEWSNQTWGNSKNNLVNTYRKIINKNIKNYSSFNNKRHRLGFLGPILREIMSRLQFRIKENVLLKGIKWPISCVAGKRSIVIDHNGSFRACEMRKSIGYFKEYNYDINKIYNSKAFKSEISNINKDKCWKNCTHGCNIGLSLMYNIKSIIYLVPFEFIKVFFRRFKFIMFQ